MQQQQMSMAAAQTTALGNRTPDSAKLRLADGQDRQKLCCKDARGKRNAEANPRFMHIGPRRVLQSL